MTSSRNGPPGNRGPSRQFRFVFLRLISPLPLSAPVMTTEPGGISPLSPRAKQVSRDWNERSSPPDSPLFLAPSSRTSPFSLPGLMATEHLDPCVHAGEFGRARPCREKSLFSPRDLVRSFSQAPTHRPLPLFFPLPKSTMRQYR